MPGLSTWNDVGFRLARAFPSVRRRPLIWHCRWVRGFLLVPPRLRPRKFLGWLTSCCANAKLAIHLLRQANCHRSFAAMSGATYFARRNQFCWRLPGLSAQAATSLEKGPIRGLDPTRRHISLTPAAPDTLSIYTISRAATRIRAPRRTSAASSTAHSTFIAARSQLQHVLLRFLICHRPRENLDVHFRAVADVLGAGAGFLPIFNTARYELGSCPV